MTFLYPYVFLLLIFLPLFFVKNSKKIMLNEKIIVNKENQKLKRVFLVIGYIFLIIAFARPVTNKKEISTNLELKKVVLAIDISRSMLAEDVYPNRLEFAKHKMNQFIDKFNGEIAILGFSNTTFLISPYTTDKETLKYLLNNIDSNYITSSGTDLQNLINTAKKMGYKDLVVFTDGGEVKKLDTKGINLYALLIGTKEGAPIKLKNGELLTKNGKVVVVKRDDKLLQFVKFGVIAETGDNDIKQLIKQNFENVKNSKKIVVYQELFIYPLWIGFIFIFLGFFSLPHLKKVIPILVIFIGVHSNAGVLDWYYLKEAKSAYVKGDYNKSVELYSKINNNQAKFNEANALYKMKKYKNALKLYNQIDDKNLKEKIEYNKGNCYAKMGKIDKAIKSYKNALQLNPNDKDAKYNLELLEKQKQKKQNKNKQKNSKNSKSNKNNDKNRNQQSKAKQNKQQKENLNNKNIKQKGNKRADKKKLKNKKRLNLNEIKPIKIELKKGKENQEIFNKIKTKTLLYPLSQGRNDNENDW